MENKVALIKSINIDKSNLEHIAKTGNINGTLLIEIGRVMDQFASQQKPEIAWLSDADLFKIAYEKFPDLENVSVSKASRQEKARDKFISGMSFCQSELKTRIQPSDLQKDSLLERILEFLKDNFDGTDREFERAAIEFKKEYESFYPKSDLQKEVETIKSDNSKVNAQLLEEVERLKDENKKLRTEPVFELIFDRNGHISGVDAPDKVIVLKSLSQFTESGSECHFDNDNYYTLKSIQIQP